MAEETFGLSVEELMRPRVEIATEFFADRIGRKAPKMHVAAIPGRRFVDPREYEKEADHLLSDLSNIPRQSSAPLGFE